MGQKGHATAMAGEFHVIELLFRRGHEASLTLGNAKTVDIFTRSLRGNTHRVSVKANRGGGKWGIGQDDFSCASDLVFVLLLYKDFDDLERLPEVWVVPAVDAERIKRPWYDQFALYSYKAVADLLEPYRNAWKYLD